MLQATRLGDQNTGCNDCGPAPLISGSLNVNINGLGAGRQTDIYEPHNCIEHDTLNDSIKQGSSSVFINGLPAARVGDAVILDGMVAQGSPNVFIGN